MRIILLQVEMTTSITAASSYPSDIGALNMEEVEATSSTYVLTKNIHYCIPFCAFRSFISALNLSSTESNDPWIID